MFIPGGPVDSTPKGTPVQKFDNVGSADFILNGTVVETKLSVYGKVRYLWTILNCQVLK
jgi:hypothetical protein